MSSRNRKTRCSMFSDIPIEGYKYYDEVKAGPGSKTGLSKWMSCRLESILEKSHGRMAHYGNIGMREQLADALIMRGISEDNCKTRHHRSIKLHGKQRKKKARDNAFPDFFRECPPFVDNSLLWHLNQMSRSKGHSIILRMSKHCLQTTGSRFCPGISINRSAETEFTINFVCQTNATVQNVAWWNFLWLLEEDNLQKSR